MISTKVKRDFQLKLFDGRKAIMKDNYVNRYERNIEVDKPFNSEGAILIWKIEKVYNPETENWERFELTSNQKNRYEEWKLFGGMF